MIGNNYVLVKRGTQMVLDLKMSTRRLAEAMHEIHGEIQ
jgi:hypothetical protein